MRNLSPSPQEATSELLTQNSLSDLHVPIANSWSNKWHPLRHGLAGILIVIWANMRGWPRNEQRAAFQPSGIATFLITLIALGGSGIITADTLNLFALGLPAVAIGTWVGWKVYGKLDETSFRKGVLVLLLISGVALVIRA